MLTLLRQGSPLADAANQVEWLEREGALPRFGQTLSDHGLAPLRATGVEVLQINVGRLCNQTCRHCHVDAGPERREIMSREILQACLSVLARTEIPVVDITGGAPEMNPYFRWFVAEVRRLGRRVIDRCNLTILTTPGNQDLPEFLAGQQVEIVASLPCYLEQNVDQQRGEGVFERSIDALRRLNALGYGQPHSDLALHLVFNPLGPSLPPPQEQLAEAYHRELESRYGVVFHRLYTITNLPISRFLDDLLQTGRYEAYMQKLIDAFNPAAAEGVMCRTTLSVDWQGRLFDCDFNQMLDLPLSPRLPRTIFDWETASLESRPIVTGRHCYGCTAGAGSSCQGSIV
ncbi:MAG: radical SAM/Cys-rich domain protein [Planctomycetaceae bacterium]|nr:radical SAM/Cys-rich domain protein [Planctomycetaceae bacterium]